MQGELLLMRTGQRLCALPVEHIEEIMRPQPWESIPGTPGYVLGAALVRGRSIPIVDLARLLGQEDESSPQRLVSLRSDDGHRVGLLVDDVFGLRQRIPMQSEAMPPLLQDAGSDIIEELGRLDGHLLSILQAGRLLCDELLQPGLLQVEDGD